MVDEMIRDTCPVMRVSADTMRDIGYTDEEIDKAHKPSGIVLNGTRYVIEAKMVGSR